MPSSKRSRGERDAPRALEPTGQHLYLIFDDWPWGYSIRKLKLPPRSPHQPSLRPLEHRRLRLLEPRRPKHKPLPPPCICLEATRHLPFLFAAVGTDIIAVHPRNDFLNALVPECILPIFDVRSLGVKFGPGLMCPGAPILITVGDEDVFALDLDCFRMLSMNPLCPLHNLSWCDLPPPPLRNIDVTSFAVDSDGQTIFISTDRATFAFDIVQSEWKQSSYSSLPFTGPANYVHALDIFVGLSKAPDTYGHLCFCRKLGDDENVRPSKENLFSKDPAESHVCATLVYLGGSEPGFCLVECVSITEGKSVNMRLEECDQLVKSVDEEGGNCGELDHLKMNVDEGDGAYGSIPECGELDELKKFVDEGDGASGSVQECGELDGLEEEFVDEGDDASGSMHYRYLYRLTTFSLSFDSNGDLTTGETCVVQCYKVPEGVSDASYLANPVAFWL
ncbi:hypothetical protein HU200_046650 [Digitaria exilis]|uniref:Uncharacterized protein n=1 Tax=Digitaria exilis TaxID=1010633 RepID=A0A835AVT0_9POAL|nr:hypothetical protein HU200_046650 [Digitaria exilis]CAB3445419.1 unnamed protein product [Digitaria exilis]